VPWTGTLTTTKVGGQTVLAEPFLTGIGCVKFPASGVGVVGLPAGLSQITWNGRPLYLFSHEELAPLPNGGGAPPGNGNGIKAFGGTFSLVVNP
jgi:hypothetical protein